VPYEKGSKAYCQVERHPAPVPFCHASARLRRHLSVNSLRLMVRSILWRREGLGPWVWDRGFESFFLQRGVIQNPIIPTDLDGQAVGLPRTKECHETGGQHDAKVKCFSL
jgi:hypothetical protein